MHLVLIVDDLHLYYFVVRRFPSHKVIGGEELDTYCRTLLNLGSIRTKVQEDYEKFTKELG